MNGWRCGQQMQKIDKRRLKSPTGSPLDPLEKQIYLKLKEIVPALSDQKVLIAVSGGVDSVALLSVVAKLKTRLKFALMVCHIDHGVRGSESFADSQFVERLAKKYHLPFYLKILEGMASSASEATLREKRYEVLFEKMRKWGAAFLITAHHQDDLLETRLMRLLQGTGINGLRAMEIKSEDGLLRPFLGVTRREIEAYVQRSGLIWCLDSSNLDTRKLRNWIRRNWLGILRQDHPEYIDNLSQSLERIVRAQEPQDLLKSDSLLNRDPVTLNDARVHGYLRRFARQRVTSTHVKEFKKRLNAPRKNFTFRLAGVDWEVTDAAVRPLKHS